MIRADASIRFATGDYASGFRSRRRLWERLLGRGHELGWHMHLMSAPGGGAFRFDPEPTWLPEAVSALRAEGEVVATRTGWDYGSAALFRQLERLGIAIDLSALPGQWVRYPVGDSHAEVDWRRAPAAAYRPSAADHQRPGADSLALIELPVTAFRNGPLGRAKRLARLLSSGRFPAGLGRKTRLLTEAWPELPEPAPFWVFHFHPEDLGGPGVARAAANVEQLRSLPGAEFVTARAAWEELKAG